MHGATETWGPKGRFGIVPLAGNQVYFFACVNAPFNDARMKNFTVADLSAQFQGYHQPISAILENTRNEDLLWNDIVDLNPLERYAYDRMVFVGDAAHATTPNLGQGACQAIEDALVLASVAEKNIRPAEAFKVFDMLRKERTHYVVKRSWTMGKVAQWTQPLLAGLRNTALRMVPAEATEKQMGFLYDVAF
jgi:2-polyprenyl-6-methoxyphenol hydroxylase-like FAD-dependent oxidoreductase